MEEVEEACLDKEANGERARRLFSAGKWSQREEEFWREECLYSWESQLPVRHFRLPIQLIVDYSGNLHRIRPRKQNSTRKRAVSPFQSTLLLRKLYNFPVYRHALPFPHPIHVHFRNVFSVGLLPQILQLLFGCRNPERVLVQHLVSRVVMQQISRFPGSELDLPAKNELRTGCS